MDLFGLIGTTLIGLVLGSFATALSYRIPREMPMIAVERSSCPSCAKKLSVLDLVPLFSWLFLRGKCRYCKAAIGLRYPLIEITTLLLCLLFYTAYGLRVETVLVLCLMPVFVSILDIDLHYKIIPDSLNLSIILLGVLALLINAVMQDMSAEFFLQSSGEAVGGAVLYGLGSLLLRQTAMWIMKREPMGLGDVKFYAASGFWLGLNPDAASIFMLVSGISGIALALIWKKRTGEAEVPFGPSLVIGLMAALYFCVPGFILSIV